MELEEAELQNVQDIIERISNKIDHFSLRVEKAKALPNVKEEIARVIELIGIVWEGTVDLIDEMQQLGEFDEEGISAGVAVKIMAYMDVVMTYMAKIHEKFPADTDITEAHSMIEISTNALKAELERVMTEKEEEEKQEASESLSAEKVSLEAPAGD